MKTSDRQRAAGFTLLELIVSIAILSVLAAAAVPVATKALNSQARKVTREEVELLAAAATEYFRDTGAIPAAQSDLESDSGVSGWSGPYLTGAVPDAVTGLSDWSVDGWSRAYQFTVGVGLTIASLGQDASAGTSDDIAVTLDFNPVRRAQTLQELTVINQAIALYNALYQATAPLGADWSSAAASIVAAGILPNDPGLVSDAWGDEYVADPAGLTPLVRVASTHLGTP